MTKRRRVGLGMRGNLLDRGEARNFIGGPRPGHPPSTAAGRRSPPSARGPTARLGWCGRRRWGRLGRNSVAVRDAGFNPVQVQGFVQSDPAFALAQAHPGFGQVHALPAPQPKLAVGAVVALQLGPRQHVIEVGALALCCGPQPVALADWPAGCADVAARPRLPRRHGPSRTAHAAPLRPARRPNSCRSLWSSWAWYGPCAAWAK